MKNRLAPGKTLNGSPGARRRAEKVQPRSAHVLPRIKYIIQGFDPFSPPGTYPATLTIIDIGKDDLEVVIQPA